MPTASDSGGQTESGDRFEDRESSCYGENTLAAEIELKSIELKSNKPNNLFEPGDELVVSVINKSAKPVHIELVGTSSRGRKVLLTPKSVVVKPGETFKLDPVTSSSPESGGSKSRCWRASTRCPRPSCSAATV